MPDRGELVRIADKEYVSPWLTGRNQRRRQIGVEHGGFVDDNELEWQRQILIVNEPPAAAVSLILFLDTEQPM